VKKIDGIQKVHPIGFCGNHVTPIRKATVDTLSRIFGMKQDIFVIGDEMVKAINSYRIHFNMNIANDINYRSFETLACETVLLTNYNRQYEELGFANGENCFFYADQTDLIRVVNTLLNRVKEGDLSMNQVAINGGMLFRDRHTFLNRAKQIASMAWGNQQ